NVETFHNETQIIAYVRIIRPVLLHFGTASWGCFYGWDNRTITCLQLLTASNGNGKSVENEENKMRKQKQSREEWFESVEQTSKHCIF
ncbi:conserved hypothetical protein, partial [Trichinella spiralis]|uniref:hypothetical protein n=1 Tax=Trichinella spiralis TaxID=6334 RepID=UPI0001EFE294